MQVYLPRPQVVLFADASSQPKIKKAGWGYWVKGDGRYASWAGGPARDGYTHDITQVELEALAIGLHHTAQAGYFRQGDEWILLQSDSMEALELLRMLRPAVLNNRHRRGLDVNVPRRQRNVTPARRERIEFLFATLDRLGLKAQVRHVKGHKSNDEGGRHAVNNLCDRLAKQGAAKGIYVK